MYPEKRFKHDTNGSDAGCFNSVVQPLLTDLYQITMAYAYWKSGKDNNTASFDLFFRKSPFKGEFTIFAGLSDCIKFLETFKISQSDIDYLKTVIPDCEPQFFEYLRNIRPDQIKIEALQEGSICFPKVPLMKVTGPLIMVQLLETVFLTLINYASLVATNAARFRIAAAKKIKLFEFGLRRAQGPDGGLSASKYAYMGGFDGTSNVLAGKVYGIPVKGTHAHAFVSSYNSIDELVGQILEVNPTAEMRTRPSGNFLEACKTWHQTLAEDLKILASESHTGELAAFASYALAFPNSFTALIDTYDVCKSGILNFCSVAFALNDFGYKALGIRIDSGDLAYLSVLIKDVFDHLASCYNLPWFSDLQIMASNDINEETILSLNEQGHKITCLGIGTHLVTCQKQPALGCVFKLVEIDGKPRLKLSQDVEKVTMPGQKKAFRLYGSDGYAILDLLQTPDEPPPRVGIRVLCRHPFEESKRAYVNPHRVEELYHVVWEDGQSLIDASLEVARQNAQESLKILRPDHRRSLNPTPYKVSVSDQLYKFIHQLWLENAPIGELS